jgi:DNA-binding XRE family transcriptional regulator
VTSGQLLSCSTLNVICGLIMRVTAQTRSPHDHGASEVKAQPGVARAFERVRRQIGRRLRALRVELALSQETAAERIGIHAKHLGRLERGEVNVTVITLVGLALAYGTTVADLFGAERSARPRGASSKPRKKRRT